MLSDPSGNIAITTLILIGSAIIGLAMASYTAYVEYNAGYDTVQIIGDSIYAGFSTFCLLFVGFVIRIDNTATNTYNTGII